MNKVHGRFATHFVGYGRNHSTEQETQFLGYKLCEMGPRSLRFGLFSLFKPLSCLYELLCSSQNKGSLALIGGLET